ncbi:MAG: chemotaxis protein CheD [Proteobacteria bacterium]|nr:chemotaxis protein CheD [Pseudomonadota bacterium]
MNLESLSLEEKTHYLHPGNLFAHYNPYIVTTILGSCIAVCLWDPINKIGGINHYMLPLWNGEGLSEPKYGNIAIKKLTEKLVVLGSKKRNLKAKVFGGSTIHENAHGLINVGERNIILARDLLEAEGIPIISSDTGGSRGRRLLFYTNTGVAKLRYIKKSSDLF